MNKIKKEPTIWLALSWCEWWVRLRARPVDEKSSQNEAPRSKGRPRSKREWLSGTARVKNRRFKSIQKLYVKKKKGTNLSVSSFWCEWWDLTLAARSRLRSFAALTVHRTVIHYRSYFKSHHTYKKQIRPTIKVGLIHVVRVMGLEPIRRGHTPLKRACLPIPAHSHI